MLPINNIRIMKIKNMPEKYPKFEKNMKIENS